MHETDHVNLDARETIRISYYYPETAPIVPENDTLHEDRFVSRKPHPDTDEGHIITVEIKHGDCFKLDVKDGLWRFVGVSVYDTSLMLFVPANDEARDARRRTNPAYYSYYRGDFSHKFAGIATDRHIKRVRPELGELPSVHAKPPAPDIPDMDTSLGVVGRIRAFLSAVAARFSL